MNKPLSMQRSAQIEGNGIAVPNLLMPTIAFYCAEGLRL
jgi:hypothetical protein